VKAYFWDLQNQLIAVEALNKAAGFGTVPPASSGPIGRVEFTYDAMGRRVTKTTFAWDASGSRFTPHESRTFFYDGWNLVKELIIDNQEPITTQTNSFVWGNDLSGSLQGAGGVGGLLAVRTEDHASTVTSHVHYPLYDHNGNVEKYIRGNGLVVAEYQYDGFGNIIYENHASTVTPHAFLFSTKYWDAEIEMNYYGYRYYSPGLGRWINRDPVYELGGLNIYAFVGNSGVEMYDVLGLARPIAPDPFDPCNDPCGDLLESIKALARYVAGRYNALKLDRLGLYGSRLKGKFSWEGHQQAYRNAQTQLRNALDKYDSRCGDPVPAYVRIAATKAVPVKPIHAELSLWDNWISNTTVSDATLQNAAYVSIGISAGALAIAGGPAVIAYLSGGGVLALAN